MRLPIQHFKTPADRPSFPLLSGRASLQRRVLPDPLCGVIGSVTGNIDLADDAEYDLGGLAPAGAVLEAVMANDERPLPMRWRISSKADVAFSASVLDDSSNNAIFTVASGAAEGIQTGQWVQMVFDTDPGQDSIQNAYGIVVDQTATTVEVSFAVTADNAAAGAGDLKVDGLVSPIEPEGVVLHDSIMIADNQDANLGALRRGIYRVEFDSTNELVVEFASDGATLIDMSQVPVAAGPLAITSAATVDDATSDSVTSLFVSSGDVILRNGADIATKIRVTFFPSLHSGLDQDGFGLVLYSKNGSLRLKNRTGATINDIVLKRVA